MINVLNKHILLRGMGLVQQTVKYSHFADSDCTCTSHPVVRILHKSSKILLAEQTQTKCYTADPRSQFHRKVKQFLTRQITLQYTNTNNFKQLLDQETSSGKIQPCFSQCYLLCVRSVCTNCIQLQEQWLSTRAKMVKIRAKKQHSKNRVILQNR